MTLGLTLVTLGLLPSCNKRQSEGTSLMGDETVLPYVTQPSSCNVFNKRDDNRTAKNEGPKQLNPCLSYLMSRDQEAPSIHFADIKMGTLYLYLVKKLYFVIRYWSDPLNGICCVFVSGVCHIRVFLCVGLT